MHTTNDEDRGLYQKYNVERTDGSSGPGGKHEHCEYFVLDLNHDPYALLALDTYAAACQGKFPNLAADLRHRFEKYLRIQKKAGLPHGHAS